MMRDQVECLDDLRRPKIRETGGLGLDYVEVSDDQLTLTLCFIGQVPAGLRKENVVIEGGRRIRGIKVLDVQPCPPDDASLSQCVDVTVDRYGDWSTYTIRLVEVDADGMPTGRAFPGLDPRYSELDFTFKAGCPSDLDCAPNAECPDVLLPEPEISYLAKDYQGFRQLVLDRLALTMPDWKETHAPDLMIALIELLAYVGDQLSYYQDAVATEAYLQTARRRISVRRHARLVDYSMHEGCNARAWLCLDLQTEDFTLDLTDVFFSTQYEGAPPAEVPLTELDFDKIRPGAVEVFEPVVGSVSTVDVRRAHSEIDIYTWGDQLCCLPAGTTTATLVDAWLAPPDTPAAGKPADPAQSPAPATPPVPPARTLHLQPGDVLIFEEVKGPITGDPADADPAHRHAVCLTRVEPTVDPLYDQPVLEIEWSTADALPFALCISARGRAPECELIENISVACGNVILVDHGRSVDTPPGWGQVPVVPSEPTCDPCGDLDPPRAGVFEPVLEGSPLTYRQPPVDSCPATGRLAQDPSEALPEVVLTSDDGATWLPLDDLLESAATAANFVVEIDNEGDAHLRFGDGESGRALTGGRVFTGRYRLGNGQSGNVGAEAISHTFFRREKWDGMKLAVRNPMPAAGGTEPEPIELVKLLAPSAFRRRLERAVTPDDYARLAEQDSSVQRAASEFRWTGSWYEARVAIDPFASEEATEDELHGVNRRLERYRRLGHDLEVVAAEYVPLQVVLTVCLLPDYLRGHVKRALEDAFSNRALGGGRHGFFHPDNLTFGDGVYLSRLVAVAQSTPGVASVSVTTLKREFAPAGDALDTGLLTMGPLEIAEVDNDPTFPEKGTLVLDLRGGR